MRGTFPVLVAVVKDQGPLGGNLTVCWAAEMEGSQVASLNLGWQRRWTPSCNQPRKRVDVVEMGQKCVQKSRNG